jgi:hypothetical protein
MATRQHWSDSTKWPTLPDWEDAHRIFGSVVGQWLRAHIDLVIAEGPCDRHEIATVLGNVPAGTPVTRIVVTTDFETALGRAQADPTRGLSQDPEFLRGQYDGWEQEFPHIRSILEVRVVRAVGDLAVLTVRDGIGQLAPHPSMVHPVHGAGQCEHRDADVGQALPGPGDGCGRNGR